MTNGSVSCDDLLCVALVIVSCALSILAFIIGNRGGSK